MIPVTLILASTSSAHTLSEEFEEKSEEGRRMMKNAELHKLAFTDLILSIDVSKARQKIINKDWKGGSITPRERLYVDISSIKGESYGRLTFWALVVNDYSTFVEATF
jgi:hypothetical protein